MQQVIYREGSILDRNLMMKMKLSNKACHQGVSTQCRRMKLGVKNCLTYNLQQNQSDTLHLNTRNNELDLVIQINSYKADRNSQEKLMIILWHNGTLSVSSLFVQFPTIISLNVYLQSNPKLTGGIWRCLTYSCYFQQSFYS